MRGRKTGAIFQGLMIRAARGRPTGVVGGCKGGTLSSSAAAVGGSAGAPAKKKRLAFTYRPW